MTVLDTPEATVSVGGTSIATENLIAVHLHLGCTREVSNFEVVVDNSNPDYHEADYSPGGDKEFTKGNEVIIKCTRGTISGSTKALLTGDLEALEYIDQAEDYQYRDVVILRGRCKGWQLFARKFNGDLISDVGSGYKTYKRAEGEAESMIAYLIDNYTETPLSHIRTTNNLFSNAASGQKDVIVVSTSAFTAGDLVKIYDDSSWEYNKIASILGDTITMTNNLVNAYTTAANGAVGLDLIRDSNTTYTKMEYSHETVFDIIKFISDTASTSGGVIGYDSRVEYDGKYAWLPRGHVTESNFDLTAEVQLERFIDDATRIKNKITVFGKADKPYPLDTDGQEYSDDWTDLSLPSRAEPLSENMSSGAKAIKVADSSGYAADDTLWIMDNNSSGELETINRVIEDSVNNSSLTADAASGQKVVDVADGTQFNVGDLVTISDDTPQTENNQIASISTNQLTMESNLTNTYTTAQNALVTQRTNQIYLDDAVSADYTTAQEALIFMVGDYASSLSQVGWGHTTDADAITIISEDTIVDTGSRSVEVQVSSSTAVNIIFIPLSAFDVTDYPNLKFKMYFTTTAPKLISIQLRSGSLTGTEWATHIFPRFDTAGEWIDYEVGVGSKNDGLWAKGASFVWTSIKQIRFQLVYEVDDDYVFYIDRLYFVGKRWGGGTSHAASDGFAEDATSQSTYGTKEHVIVNDMLLSDAECEAKARGLLAFYKDPRATYELETETLDWGDYPIYVGDKISVDLTPLGITGDKRVDSVDIHLTSIDHKLVATFILDNTPPREADYLYNLSKKVRELERNYKNIR